MATKLAYCGNFMNGYDGNGNGVFIKLTSGVNIPSTHYPHITINGNCDKDIVTSHISGLINNGKNDTDSDIFTITSSDGQNSSLDVYQSPCTPRMFCLYSKSSSSSTTLIAKNHDMQMKEIYSSSTASAASLTIANDYQKLSEPGVYNNVSRMFNVIDNNVLNKITSSRIFKVSFTLRPSSKPSTTINQIPGGFFDGCENLLKCKIPGHIHTIPGSAFGYCSSLSSITYQNSDFLWWIGPNAFHDCIELKEFRIPKYCDISYSTVDGGYINESIFKGCTQLSRVVFEGYKYKSPNNIISGNCENQCEDDNIECFMTFIGLGYSGGNENYNRIIKKIPAHCFNGCTMLLGSATPDAPGTSYVDDNYILWKSFHIPFGVDEIGDYAFSGCTNLCREKLEVDNSQNGGVFLNGVKRIGNYAFTGCQHIRYLVGLNYGIGDYYVENIGDYAFSGCTNLQYLYSKGYNNRCVAENEILGVIGEGAFKDCTNLSSITISDDVYVGDYAFSGCANLTDVYIYRSNNCIDENSICYNLINIFGEHSQQGEKTITFHIEGIENECECLQTGQVMPIKNCLTSRFARCNYTFVDFQP